MQTPVYNNKWKDCCGERGRDGVEGRGWKDRKGDRGFKGMNGEGSMVFYLNCRK